MWPKNTEEILKILGKEEEIQDFILVGGSALSFYLKHRLSEDIDLFTAQDVLDENQIYKLLKKLKDKKIKIIPRFSKFNKKNQPIQYDYILDKTKVTFYAYEFDFISKKENSEILFDNLKIAKLKILMAMKTTLLNYRGKLRDYYDLYVLSKKFGLNKLIKETLKIQPLFYNEKLFLKQLTGLIDIKENFLSSDLKPSYNISKAEIEEYFKKEIEKYLKDKYDDKDKA